MRIYDYSRPSNVSVIPRSDTALPELYGKFRNPLLTSRDNDALTRKP